MQSLRHAHYLARFVLVWFALALGVAIASPLVQPKSMTLICSDAGVLRLVSQGSDDGVSLIDDHTLKCPLCMVSGAPPPVAHVVLPRLSAPADVHPGQFARDISATASILPPARGPPRTL